MTTMTLTKLPPLKMNRQGRWVLTYAEKLPNGRWATREVSTHTRIRAEAEAFRARWVSDRHALGALPPDTSGADSEHLMADLIRGYLADLEHRGGGKYDQRALSKIADGVLGALYPRQLTPEVVFDWCRTRRVGDSTLRRDLQALRTVLNWAVRVKRLKHDDVPHIALPDAGPARDVWLDEAEEQKLFDLASQDTLAPRGSGPLAKRGWAWHTPGCLSMGGAFICIALSTGARREAIEDLTWDRVDFKARTINFAVPGRRVTKKLRAVTPIDDRLLPVLVRLKHEWEHVHKVVTPKVIQGDQWPRKRVFQIIRECGFAKHITPHVFRHTFVTLSLRRGMAMWDVGQAAGVSSKTMEKHYAHHGADSRLLKEMNKRFAA